MDCLNGFFQDVYAQPLGVTLLLAPNGGAVAVLASTGLNQPAPQTKLDALVVQNALTGAIDAGRIDSQGEVTNRRPRRAAHLRSVRRSGDAG